jgi:hypothetical protein
LRQEISPIPNLQAAIEIGTKRRAAERHIGEMEEKAVALVNIVEKSREAANGLSSERLASAR